MPNPFSSRTSVTESASTSPPYAARIERAIGWVECDSASAASRRISRSPKPLRETVRTTLKVPRVSVPVLSTTTVWRLVSASR